MCLNEHLKQPKSNRKTHLKIVVSLFLETIVKKSYDVNLKLFQAYSTVEDIDNTFELFTDDFTYVHPKYGGVYPERGFV